VILGGVLLSGDVLMQRAAVGCELGLSALGAVVWYLRHSQLDQELISMGKFERYCPVDLAASSGELEEVGGNSSENGINGSQSSSAPPSTGGSSAQLVGRRHMVREYIS